jgi:hypothetical protein
MLSERVHGPDGAQEKFAISGQATLGREAKGVDLTREGTNVD